MIRLISVLCVLASLSCQTNEKTLDIEHVTFEKLQIDTVADWVKEYGILDSVEIIYKSDDIVIATGRSELHLTNEYIAYLFLIKDGIIVNKMERTNGKYHAGTFELVNNIKTEGIMIRYEILLPTGSVPHVAILHEYIEVTAKIELKSRFKFYAEERDCTLGRKNGQLTKRELIDENGAFLLQSKMYEFDCKRFVFKGEIDSLQLLSEWREKPDALEK
ncbi:MAG: hypothetical protein AB8B72_11865 [Crocinitomicaceae bacterium]